MSTLGMLSRNQMPIGAVVPGVSISPAGSSPRPVERRPCCRPQHPALVCCMPCASLLWLVSLQLSAACRNVRPPAPHRPHARPRHRRLSAMLLSPYPVCCTLTTNSRSGAPALSGLLRLAVGSMGFANSGSAQGPALTVGAAAEPAWGLISGPETGGTGWWSGYSALDSAGWHQDRQHVCSSEIASAGTAMQDGIDPGKCAHAGVGAPSAVAPRAMSTCAGRKLHASRLNFFSLLFQCLISTTTFASARQSTPEYYAIASDASTRYA